MGQNKGTMRWSLRRIRTMAALLALALVASGCTSFNGGGFLRTASTDPAEINEKANFGINGKCRNGEFNLGTLGVVQGAGLYDGQFQYDDHAFTMNGFAVKFHGNVVPDAVDEAAIVFLGMTCKEVEQFLAGDVSVGVAPFQGTYRPQNKDLAKACPKNIESTNCTFTGTISDLGEPGVQSGDAFEVNVKGGPFNGYTNAGPIQGGNLQVD